MAAMAAPDFNTPALPQATTTPPAPSQATQITPEMSGALRLTDWGLLRADGADGASFLHGQLTQDTQGLRNDQARLAGYCSAKGRLLASLVVWRPAPDTLWLACSADLLAPTLKRLSMFVMRAKCKLSDATATQSLWGLAGEAARLWLGAAAPAAVWGVAMLGTAEAPAQVIRLPDAQGLPRYLLAQPADAAAPALPALAEAHWRWLEVRSAVARVVAATAEQFVPQMVNLELVGGVNFQKGCYPGQEVVARSQYRGTLKRRAMLFDSAGDAALAPGQEVFHSADPGQPAGLVVLAAARPGGGHSALVEVKLAALDSGTLHAGSADGPLLLRSALPYSLPAEHA
jgi:folate-binding protein YgfZ